MNKFKKASAICAVISIIAIVQQIAPQLRTSQQGLAIIGNAEGCRRDPYICPAGVRTVGIGSTESSGEPIIEYKRYSDVEIARRWAKDIEQAENCVNRYANGSAMPQGAFDALTSITFNIGCGKLRNSTLFKLANQGYSTEMCQQLNRWIYSNGKVLTGLVERRKKETALCLQH